MRKMEKPRITVFAPAKINLFLHITRRLGNGYHSIDSLVAFADIGDYIIIEHASSFLFNIEGKFAKDLQNDSDNNLVVKAAKSLAQITGNLPNVKITLKKNLPVSSGIGGGSSDAAAVIWGLQELWSLAHDADYVLPLMTRLGADVPVCQYCKPTLMRGIGDIISSAPPMPEIPILLINPMIPCSTSDVFLRYDITTIGNNMKLPKRFKSVFDLVKFLNATNNDLLEPATKLIPEIDNVINSLNAQNKCLLSRMSGAGASCFGLFENIEDAKLSAKVIKEENPDWWVESGWLNRPDRY